MQLLHGQSALRVAFHKRIVHALHFGVMRQELRDPQSIVILPLYPDRKRLDTAQQEPGRVGIHDAAQCGAGGVDGVDQVLTSGDDAADQV